jgi:hypothetical protein
MSGASSPEPTEATCKLLNLQTFLPHNHTHHAGIQNLPVSNIAKRPLPTVETLHRFFCSASLFHALHLNASRSDALITTSLSTLCNLPKTSSEGRL